MLRKLLLLGLLACPVAAQPTSNLPKDIASRWLSLGALVERFKEGTLLETVAAEPIIQGKPIPFQDLGLAPNRLQPVVSAPLTWSVPPFAQIGPPGDTGAEEAAVSGAPTFQGIGTEDQPMVSNQLRPLPGPKQLHLSFQDYTIPEALSRVCYSAGGAGLCQLSLYGGTNSFFAEQAYFALHAALDTREPLEGFGKEAVLGIYREPEEKEPEKAEGMPFEGVEVVGKPRPDLVDPGLLQARKAPAFQEISTSLTPGGRLDLSRLPRVKPTKAVRARRQYWALLAYFPERALTAELLIDLRLGTPQDLVDLAGGLQTKIHAYR